MLYDSSLMADNDPYELVEKGEPTGIVELPVEWIRDDAPYFNMNRFQALRPYTPPTAVLDIFLREFEGAYAEGGLFLLTMHPHVTGYRSRLFILEELIRAAKGQGRLLVRDARGRCTPLRQRSRPLAGMMISNSCRLIVGAYLPFTEPGMALADPVFRKDPAP